MERKIKNHMLASSQLYKQQKIIIGLSGGADSIALLEMLVRLQEEFSLELVAIHVHHGIREEAYEDVDLCIKACEQRNIKLFIEYRDVPKIAHTEGISLEEAGRNERYHIFESYRMRLAFDSIAIAHHMNDRAETMLFQLFRGSGLKGLTGIPGVRGKIIRPLLGITRKEIEEFLEINEIPYIVDRTNLDPKYTRNRIRNEVLPIAEEIVSQATQHMNQTADQLMEVLDFMQTQINEFVDKYVRMDEEQMLLSVPTVSLQQQHIALQKMIVLRLIEMLEDSRKNITSKHVQAILAMLCKEGEKQLNLPNGICAVKSYGMLLLKKKQEEFVQENRTKYLDVLTEGVYELEDGLNVEISFEKVDGKANILEKIPQNDCTKWFDYDRIQLSLSLRGRQTGDYFMIDVNGKRKSLKSYLIDEKVPKHKRDQIWLLADGQHILWILGKRISSYYKVTSETKNILKVHIGGYHGS